jgi:hypothetical protein
LSESATSVSFLLAPLTASLPEADQGEKEPADDQPTETYWTAWAREDLPDEYVFPIVGDPHSKYEVTRIAE